MSCQPPVSYSDPTSVAELHEPLRSRVAQAIHDAPVRTKAATGTALTLFLVSGKRTDYMQWLLRHQRVPAGQECNSAYPGVPLTAVPGHSHHRNIAADIAAADLGGSALDWLAAHEAEYGLKRTVPSERWHFEAVGTPTRKITPFDGSSVVVPKWEPFHAGDTNKTVEARGGYDNEVFEVQLRLKLLAKSWNDSLLDPGVLDGSYGPKGVSAVARFKVRIIALQKANNQTPWPNTDDIVGDSTIKMLRWWTA